MIKASTLFFDLDGTLADSLESVARCFAYALRQMGVEPPSKEYIAAHYMGPPIFESLATHVGKDKAQEALDHYVNRYVHQRCGITEARIYDGIPDLLEKLAATKALYVMTSKSAGISKEIVAHFGLNRFFKEVYGPLPDELQHKKADLLARACRENGIDPADAVMIGDRMYDLDAAAENGMKSIGVTWGYGPEAELKAHHATAIAHTPDDLLQILSA